MRGEPRPLATTVRYVILVGGVLLLAVPIYVYLEPQWRAHSTLLLSLAFTFDK